MVSDALEDKCEVKVSVSLQHIRDTEQCTVPFGSGRRQCSVKNVKDITGRCPTNALFSHSRKYCQTPGAICLFMVQINHVPLSTTPLML